MDPQIYCIICNERLASQRTVEIQSKGRLSVVRASILRSDGKADLFKYTTPLKIHFNCQKNYTSQKSIDQHIRLRTAGPSSSNSGISPVKLRSSAEYSFKDKCLFCLEEISSDYDARQKKLSTEKRRPYNKVTTHDLLKNILRELLGKNDKKSKDLRKRLQSTSDLVAADAKYHRDCCSSFFSPGNPDAKKGRQSDVEIQGAMNEIFSHIENNEDCQFTFEELMNVPHNKNCFVRNTLKKKLIEKYDDNIEFANIAGKKTVICFRDRGREILNDAWYDDRILEDEKSERMRIVKTAAEIIRNDIRSNPYDNTKYPSSRNYLDEQDLLIPDTLKSFLEGIILPRKKNPEQYEKQCITIAHTIISAVRPRSFISPILTSIGLYIYRKFESKILVNLLANLGLSASYDEVRKLETSALMQDDVKISENSFAQFSFDNADFNACTLDGLNTIHMMGGILCITPSENILPSPPIMRVNKQLTKDEISAKSTVGVETYEPASGTVGINGIIISDEDQNLKYLDRETETMFLDDVLWICCKIWHTEKTAGWSGFNSKINRIYSFDVSSVLYLPFINQPPSNYDTIYTTIQIARQKCLELNQKSVILTFDQPLFTKARDIVESLKLENVFIRLGGFHLLMSYLGSIGYIMANSGLKDALSQVYASTSVEKMLTGHAFNRAIRGHSLIFEALMRLVFDTIDVSEEFKDSIIDYLENSPLEENDITKSDDLRLFNEKIEQEFTRLTGKGPTAALWIEYVQMIILMKNFIRSERTGDWFLHLRCIRNMIPYFYASGHHLYAKSAQLYLHDMATLQQRMDKEEFCKFVHDGMFTIRRSDRYWAGIWSDMTIEQTEMRSMKARGGLTRGRGISDSVLSRWILGMRPTMEICDTLENFSNVRFESSEQHVSIDERASRISRDNTDVNKICNFFDKHPPFSESKSMMSLSTGLCNSRANCHLAYDKGSEAMRNAYGRRYGEITVKKVDRVITLASVSSTPSTEDLYPSNPFALFNRLTIVGNSEEKLRECFEYELSPIPVAMFDEHGMRKNEKSKFYSLLPEISNYLQIPNTVYVIDGGFLLHRVVWPTGANFQNICNAYVNYVTKHFGKSSIIVFDGYINTDIKKWERIRRKKSKPQSSFVKISLENEPPASQRNFLNNDSNKEELIMKLSTILQNCEIKTIMAEGDADRLIVDTAISIRKKSPTVVVGTDVDLLAIIIALAVAEEEIILWKPGKGLNQNSFYSSSEIQKKFPGIENYILFFHALSGCDTTSAIHNKGKTIFFKLFQTTEDLRKMGLEFIQKNVTQSELGKNAAICFQKIYGMTGEESLNDLRYSFFEKRALHSSDMLLSLPPTDEAAFQHILRVYCQVQQWLGEKIDPKNYGWRWDEENQVHLPILTTKPPAPETLMSKIFCKCTTGCGSSCGCRKTGLQCSSKCGNCSGIDCSNPSKLEVSLEDSDSELEDLL